MLRQIVDLCATSRNKAERARQISCAKQDIVNDSLRGLILFPHLVHHSSVHFVDAASVDLLFGSIGTAISIVELMVSVAQPKQMRRVNHKIQPVTSETPMR